MDRADDPSIRDDDLLWRRVVPEWIVYELDGSSRLSSLAFRDKRGEISVHLAKLTNPETVLQSHPGDGIVAITAGQARALGYRIALDPTPADQSHALICAPPERGTKEKERDAKRFAQTAQWLIRPGG